MRSIAFDLDGTLTIPRYALLARWLSSPTQEIFILTGGLNGKPTQKERLDQIEELDLDFDFSLARVCGKNRQEVAEKKAEFINQNGISMMFDDDPLYCRVIREMCPETVVFEVEP